MSKDNARFELESAILMHLMWHAPAMQTFRVTFQVKRTHFTEINFWALASSSNTVFLSKDQKLGGKPTGESFLNVGIILDQIGWLNRTKKKQTKKTNIGLTIPGKLLVFRCGFHVKSTWHSLPTALHATEEFFLKSLIYKVSRWISWNPADFRWNSHEICWISCWEICRISPDIHWISWNP